MSVMKIKDICIKCSSNLKQKDVEGKKGIYPVFGASGEISKIDFFQQGKEYIAIVKDGSGIGRVSFMPSKSSVIGTMQYILPVKGFNIKYISYCLKSLNLSKYKQGAAIPHIYFRDYGERIVNVTTDENEQTRIVSILDAAFAKIDRLKAIAEEKKQAVKDLWQAHIEILFNNWNGTYIKLSSISSIVSGFAFKSSQFQKNGKYQVVRIGNVKQNGIRLDSSPVFISGISDNDFQKSHLEIGDLVITQTGTKHKRDYGFVALIDADNLLLNQRVARIRITDKKDFLANFFLYYSFSESYKKQFFSNEGGAVGQGNVGISALTDMQVPFCDFNDQKTIITKLDTISTNLKSMEECYDKEIAECESLKQSILRKAFSGEL